MSDSRSEIEVPPTGLLPENNPEDHQQEAGERQKSPREIAMEAIYARRAQQMEAENEQAHDAVERLPENELGGAIEEPAVEQVDPEPVARTPAVREPAPSAPSAAETFAVEVDGQQLHVTRDQMAALARMGVIANQALHQYQRQAPQFQPPALVERPVVDDARVRETIKKIQYGNEDDATGALTSLILDVTQRAPQAPQIDPMVVANYAAGIAQQRAQLTNDTDTIRREFSDLFDNPIRSNAAAQQVTAIRQRNMSLGHNQSDLDIYREAGLRVREAFGMTAPQSGVTGDSTASQAAPPIVVRSRGEVERRKREAPRSTSQVIDRRSAAPEAPRPPTSADIVEMMRKARGQTSMR